MDPYTDTMNQVFGQSISAMSNYAKIWTDMMGNMAMAGMSFTPGATPPDAARQVRNSAFRAWADALDDSMRTPQFLDMIRQSMDTMLTFRKQMDGMMTQTRQMMQGTTREDVDTLMISLRHMERRILDRMEDLNERLDDLEERMDQPAGNGQEAEAPRRSRRYSSRRPKSSPRE